MRSGAEGVVETRVEVPHYISQSTTLGGVRQLRRLQTCAQSLGLRGGLELLPRSARTNDRLEVKAGYRGDQGDERLGKG